MPETASNSAHRAKRDAFIKDDSRSIRVSNVSERDRTVYDSAQLTKFWYSNHNAVLLKNNLGKDESPCQRSAVFPSFPSPRFKGAQGSIENHCE